MVTFSHTAELVGASFVDVDMRDALFFEVDLSGSVLRAVHLRGTAIDAPWLGAGDSSLMINGVDVVPFVEAELNQRFPGRGQRRAEDPDGLRAAWAAVEQIWTTTLDRVEAMPTGTVDISVGGEWSFAQTLRHLILATDTWLRRAIVGVDQPFHPIGLMDVADDTSVVPGVFREDVPSYAEVLEVRAGRIAMMRDYLAAITSAELRRPRVNPWEPQEPETTLSCLHVILHEEWEHHRYAVRDLDAIDAEIDGRTG